jgi:hypothetical protein
MTRWEFINSDEYIDAGIELIIRSGRPVKEMRKELSEKFKQLRDELLHGQQPASGCGNKKCKVCYPYKHSFESRNA